MSKEELYKSVEVNNNFFFRGVYKKILSNYNTIPPSPRHQDICMHKLASPTYKKLSALCEYYTFEKVDSLSLQLHRDNTSFLQLVDDVWRCHCEHMRTIRNIFLYLDRSFCLSTQGVKVNETDSYIKCIVVPLNRFFFLFRVFGILVLHPLEAVYRCIYVFPLLLALPRSIFVFSLSFYMPFSPFPYPLSPILFFFEVTRRVTESSDCFVVIYDGQ